MPKALHDKLAREAKKKGFGKERTAAYVYGTLENVKKAKKARAKKK